MSRLPILDALEKYKDKNTFYFAMPGHKMGKAYNNKEGMQFVNNIINYDITEIEGVDNLHNPSGIIKEAQEKLSDYYGSKKSYFLVNGSTSGNMIMIFSLFNENDKIIVERNCHRSVFNSIILRKLRPIYVNNKFNDAFGAPFSIDKEHLLSVIKENTDARGILLTYPNYYGICTDLEEVILEAKKYGMKILIDGAHGAHFDASNKLPSSPIKLGCDLVVNSAHKTLPSLTQTAFLHVNSKELIEKVDFYMSVFSTTSPSYIFLASMDYSRYYLEVYGEKQYDNLISLCNKYRKKINESNFFHIINNDDFKEKKIVVDQTRYTINVPKGYSGHRLSKHLLDNGIQPEMSDDRNVVLIFSPCNTEDDMRHLYKALEQCPRDLLKKVDIPMKEYSIPPMKKLPWEAINTVSKLCSVENSFKSICRQAVVPYPPGIPLIMPGEIITQEVIDIINYYRHNGVTLLGLENDNIVVCED